MCSSVLGLTTSFGFCCTGTCSSFKAKNSWEIVKVSEGSDFKGRERQLKKTHCKFITRDMEDSSYRTDILDFLLSVMLYSVVERMEICQSKRQLCHISESWHIPNIQQFFYNPCAGNGGIFSALIHHINILKFELEYWSRMMLDDVTLFRLQGTVWPPWKPYFV